MSRCSVRPMIPSTSSIRSRWAPDSRATSVFQNDLSPASASSRFSNTVSYSNTVGFWNLRPMPACGDLRFG